MISLISVYKSPGVSLYTDNVDRLEICFLIYFDFDFLPLLLVCTLCSAEGACISNNQSAIILHFFIVFKVIMLSNDVHSAECVM